MTRLLMILTTILLIIAILSNCRFAKEEPYLDPRGSLYAERTSCQTCHRSVSDQFNETSHFHTSSVFKGEGLDLSEAPVTFDFSEHLRVEIQKRDSQIFQVAYSGNTELQASPFNIIFGSGEKAQTYAYWNDGGLFQLPLSYYTTIAAWANSPGFPENRANFERAIISRCLECHSSYSKEKLVKSGPLKVTKQVVKGSILFGIDCQRCHGPAARHVEFHTENAGEKQPRYIQTFKSLSRQQKIDVCAVCHSGNDQLTQRSTFGFKPGDTLSNFYYPRYTSSGTEDDVHGKQFQMMAASACFIKSDMDCSTCHDPHRSGNELPAALVQKCLDCHKGQKHPDIDQKGTALLNNCIDCHMPLQASRQIHFQVAGKDQKEPYMLRNHKIGIYQKETELILSYLRKIGEK